MSTIDKPVRKPRLRSKRKLLSGKLYLSKLCPHCKRVFGKIDQVKKNFADLGITINVEFIDESIEFYTHDFDAVPTLVIPLQRPLTGIDESWLVDPDKVRKLVLGEASGDDVKHDTAKKREIAGISKSDKWWKT